MQLITLGAILKFALELETTAAAFYEAASHKMADQGTKSLFDAFIVQSQKRIQMLMRVRREHTTEMILEPIVGLKAEDYHPQTAFPESASNSALLDVATKMETKLSNFYLDAAQKISFLGEPADIFEQIAEAHIENKKQLNTASS